jgi:hypothetical protein
MAAAANDEAPILVRNDPIMYDFLQKQQDKFKITIDITSDKEIYAQYEICLFMYDMKSRLRNDCPNLKENYHSHSRGRGCSYVGFINKELDDNVHSAFFYSQYTTTWFLDYNIIEPNIKIEEIKEENYLKPFIMNKNAKNQIKKISYAAGDLITYISSARSGDIETIETFVGTLPGEHVVISNGLKPIFTLSELFFNYNYTESNNILSRVLNKFLIIALLNNENKFTYKNGPNEKRANLNFDIKVNSVEYITAHTEKYLTCSVNINECIKNILTCLKNDSVANYVQSNLLPEIEGNPKRFNIMDKKISTFQKELFLIFKYRLPFDLNKQLIEAKNIINEGYIPLNKQIRTDKGYILSDKTIFTEVSEILEAKKEEYFKKNIEFDDHFQGLIDLADTISDPQLITKTMERKKLAERVNESVLNKFDEEINEQASLNAKIIENQQQMERTRNEKEAKRAEYEAKRKQEYEQMSSENKQKNLKERKKFFKLSKTAEEKEMMEIIERQRKAEENHTPQLQKQLLSEEYRKQQIAKKKEQTYSNILDEQLNDSKRSLITDITIFLKLSIDNKKNILAQTKEDNKKYVPRHQGLIEAQTKLEQMKDDLIEIVSHNLLNADSDPLIALTKKYLPDQFIKDRNILINYGRRNLAKRKRNNASMVQGSNGPASKKKTNPSRGGFKKITQRKKKKLTRKMRK